MSVVEMREDVVNSFMAGFQEGVCPLCGGEGECVDSDEGTATEHFLDHLYECYDCHATWTERFMCNPLRIEVDGMRGDDGVWRKIW